jgi:hypothetical protein
MITQLKNVKTLVLGLFVLTLSLSACKKDKLANDLEGEWKVTSFTFDGEESIGVDINSFKMEYEDYDSDDQEGDFEWNFVYSDGTTESNSGEYEVDGDDKELTVTITNGISISIKFDIDLDDDKLELSGNIDGESVVIKAERD